MEKSNYVVRSISAWMILAIIFLLITTGCYGENKMIDNNKESNIAIVKNYFRAIDNRDAGAMSDLFTVDAKQDFVGNDPIVGVKAIGETLELVLSQLESMKTEFINFVADGDTVSAHVKHVAVFKAGGAFKNRTGITPTVMILSDPMNVSWQAMATFRIEDDKIVEEIIIRDELAILQQLGVITLKTK